MTAVEEAWRDEWGRLLALLVAPLPPPRPRRGRSRRRVRGRRTHLAGRRHAGQPGRLAAHRRPQPDPGPPPRRGGARPQAADPGRRGRADRGGPARDGRRQRAGQPRGSAYDERLRLVLLCAHPSLAPEAAAALTLRLVMGIATEDIARLFLVPTADDGGAAHPGPQAAGAGELRPADRVRPRGPAGAGGRRRLPRVHGRLRARIRRGRAASRAGRPRRSAWPGCCARWRPRTSSSTPCWP